jgi:N-carbamoylputrescine amidase
MDRGAVLLAALASGCLESWGDYQYLSGPNGWSGPTRYDDAHADVRFDVAASSLAVTKDKAENLDRIADRVDEIVAERPSVEIVVFGETITGWYRVGDDAENAAYQRSIAEPIPGPTTDLLGAVARDHGVYLGFGMAEDAGDDLYNAFVLLDPDGAVLAVHRKFLVVHSDVVTSMDNPYTAGDGATVTAIDRVPFGILICNDMHSLEVAEDLTAADVRVVLSPLADPSRSVEVGGWSPIPTVWNAWVVSANQPGQEGDWEYPGSTSIVDPAGTVRASFDGDGWVAAELGVYR